jgi:hypothetical protein
VRAERLASGLAREGTRGAEKRLGWSESGCRPRCKVMWWLEARKRPFLLLSALVPRHNGGIDPSVNSGEFRNDATRADDGESPLSPLALASDVTRRKITVYIHY